MLDRPSSRACRPGDVSALETSPGEGGTDPRRDGAAASAVQRQAIPYSRLGICRIVTFPDKEMRQLATQSSRVEAEAPSPLASRRLSGRGGEDPRSPAAWLVLALVIEQPSHGYEICQRYQRRFGDMLPTSVPRVYGALDRLRDAGMIRPIASKPAKPAGKQHLMRRSYRATDAGLEAYHRWVAERMRDDPQRPQLLARITSSGLLGTDAVLDVIDRYQEECMEELRALPTGSELLESGQASLQELTESLVIDQQRRELRARSDWAAHARKVLEAHKQSAPDELAEGIEEAS
jgi:DNA-binding PadR family transcriptional regulator